MKDNFKQGSKIGIRFTPGKGLVNIEDLWVLPIETVDRMAIETEERVEKGTKKSFIKPAAQGKEAKLDVLRLAILKEVIETRVAEAEAKKLAKAKRAKRARLQELLERKQETALEAKSEEELNALIAEMDAEEA